MTARTIIREAYEACARIAEDYRATTQFPQITKAIALRIRAAAADLPPEPDEAARLREVLNAMAAELQWTIDFDRAARDRQGFDTSADTHIMAPPSWPTHGALTNQIVALKQAADLLAPTEAAGG